VRGRRGIHGLGTWHNEVRRAERDLGVVLAHAQRRERADDARRFEADRDDLANQAEDIGWIVSAVGVVGDAAALVGGDLLLVDDPFEGGAVAEAVFVGFGRDAGQSQELVVDERSFVLAQFHLDDAVVELFAGLFYLVIGYRVVVGSGWISARRWPALTKARKTAVAVALPVACELRSPATAFGRVELFSFFATTPDLRPGLYSAAPPGLEFANAEASSLP
jgi:hypothetical protein